MKLRKAAILAAGAAVALPIAAADGLSPRTWPERDLAKFVFEHLDLSSFRNSTGPRRRPGQRLFRDLGIHPDQVSDTEAASTQDEWLYAVRILGKHDYNSDGTTELLICFSDVARNGGSYSMVSPYVVQLIDGRVIALAYADDPNAEASGCKSPGSRAATEPGTQA